MSKFLSYKDTVGMELAYSAIAACEGDLTEAVGWMKQAGYTITEANLASFQRNRATEVEQARVRVAPRVEAALTSEMLGEAVKLTAVIDSAVELASERLEEGRVEDPAKMARDLAQVRSQGLEKMMSLEGRPTQITETRNTDEVIRALEGLGVARTIESTAEEIPDV